MYSKIENGLAIESGLSEYQIKQRFPDTSFPNTFTPPDGYVKVEPTSRPAFDPLTQSLTEGTPVFDNGVLEQRWVLTQLAPEVAQANAEAAEARRVEKIWKAAHDYEFAQVSGSAIGLLAMGVMQGLPKCLAVQNWIKSIWTLYYTRKATASDDTDYSSCGEVPHSVPELMAELGV